MADQRQLVDKAVLRILIPVSALNQESFHELAGKTYVEEVPAGKTIFRQGEADRKNAYVIEGEAQITSNRASR